MCRQPEPQNEEPMSKECKLLMLNGEHSKKKEHLTILNNMLGIYKYEHEKMNKAKYESSTL